MVTLNDYIQQVQTLVHDTNGADFSQSTLTAFINQARNRVALDTHCVRQFFGQKTGNALNTIPRQENYLYNGVVAGINVNSSLGGWITPRVTVDDPPDGNFATAEAVVTNGHITAINMTYWGTGYTGPINVVVDDLSGPNTSGHGYVSTTAIVLFNVLDILSLTAIWGQERIVFEWMPFTMFQTFCRQFTNQFNVPSVFTMHQGTQQFYLFQIPDQAYVIEMDAITLPQTILVDGSDVETDITLQYTDAVQFFAAHLCMASLQNLAMADYWYSGDVKKPGKYDIRIKQLASTSFSRRIYNPYRAFSKRLRRM